MECLPAIDFRPQWSGVWLAFGAFVAGEVEAVDYWSWIHTRARGLGDGSGSAR